MGSRSHWPYTDIPSISTINSTFLANARVCLRLDLNIHPETISTVKNDPKIIAALPTVQHLKKHNAKVLIITHIEKSIRDTIYPSTSFLLPILQRHGIACTFIHSYTDIPTIWQRPEQFFLLENIRRWPEEKMHDVSFARHLACGSTMYITDAFAATHRHDTSISLLPLQYRHDRRYAGFLIERELSALHQFATADLHPYIAVLGGAKTATKIPLAAQLLHYVDTILLCPPLSFCILARQKKSVGRSYIGQYDTRSVETIIKHIGSRVLLPEDYLIQLPNNSYTEVPADAIPPEGIGIAIGSKTIELFSQVLHAAQKTFFNGFMGFAAQPETLYANQVLWQNINSTNGIHIAAGGDTLPVINSLGFSDIFTYLSTGGGASCAYLAHQTLPGLEIFY